MVEVLLLTIALNCPALDVPAADEIASVLQTGWESEAVYGTTAPYDFPTEPQPSEDGTLSYRIYVDPLYETYTQCFDEIVTDVLTDRRGWENMRRAGPTEAPQMWIILAPPGGACATDQWPYASCAGGRQARINAGRWFAGYGNKPLADSRAYLINHEVGHLLGLLHADCSVMGYPRWTPEVAGGPWSTGWDTCDLTPWPIRMVADSQL